MLPPGLIFAVSAVALFMLAWPLRWPLPVALIVVSILAALLAGFGVPFRHLVEGSFGYINLVLALFAGAFFGQAMQASGIADALGRRVHGLFRGNPLLIMALAATLIFAVGMFVGIAGVAVLATGALVVPMLKATGLEPGRIGAFVAVIAACGMVAPPLNVPAMTIADGVNMPYIGFALPLLVLSVPPTLLMIALSARQVGRSPALPPVEGERRLALLGLLAIAAILGFWTLLRLFPNVIPDPAVPIVLVVGALFALPALGRRGIGAAAAQTFTGTPLVLAAVLISVGVAVQIMTLTGMRGFLVINSMTFPPPWIFLQMIVMPVLGGVLTSIGSANVLGVPFAFALIHQDMILNVSGLSAIAALAEFMPPTAISAALASYVVGDTRLGAVLRASLWPALLIGLLGLLMLVFAESLTPLLISDVVTIRDH
jgi:TRAP-type C4-dicarboxylate transport system permease large subunit